MGRASPREVRFYRKLFVSQVLISLHFGNWLEA
jgi:hypothetical protein